MSVSNANPGLWTTLRRHLNFFRIHLLFFTFTPLIGSVILYASNGRYPIAYIDALYMSVSAVTVCGLSTVNLSPLTPWQQVLLFLQMCVGSPVLVSWFMVYIRRHFFAKKFEYIIQAEAARRGASKTLLQQSPEPAMANTTGRRTYGWGVASLFRRRNGNGLSDVAEESTSTNENGSSTPGEKKVRTNMIRRMDAPPKRVDPSGWVSEEIAAPLRRFPNSGGGTEKAHVAEHTSSPGQIEPPSPTAVGMPRTTTIEFAPPVTRHYVSLSTVPGRHGDRARDPSVDERLRRQISRDSLYSRRYPGVGGMSQVSLARHTSQHAPLPNTDQIGLGQAQASSQTDFGGFPMPHKLLGMFFRSLFPGATNRLRKTVTIPAKTALAGGEMGRTATITGATGNIPKGTKPVSYISFDVIVGRNSYFQMLTNEQLEELGGVEYRGLNALLWLVALYHIGSQLVSFVVIAPYMTLPKWANDFVPPALTRSVATPWFSIFQVVSAYTNTGFSLVDQSMIPFQTAYPMILFMIFLIVAGNTGFVSVSLLSKCRFSWTIAKLIPTKSRLYETLHFLLDHPRRCFVYLFPAHQTWFLLSVLVLLNSIDFFCFMVLNIGIPEIESIPFGTRFAVGLLQATDVRASGFNIVPVAAMAPAVKVMYVIMMYISVCAVRSTNVYEEQSLGIFHPDDQLSAAEQVFNTNGSRMAMWGRYLAMHARYQLSFDMWWLALALFLICIIERDNLINPENQGWFNIFTILFEIVSAYGSVGLSLGIPTQYYSLSGAFRPLSKLVVCLVMIRGRHRGLPVALDRAIVLPYEFERAQDNPDPPPSVDERRSSRYSVGAVSHPVEGSVDDVEHEQTSAEVKWETRKVNG
ncbi:cation transport protein-domain-containing protein [Boletus edulis BED1]|uniref:Potassium transport protein n=1 Tax=Boletus edulis BED1 TaxID=1328754 RepID=A0AAD4BNM3_BOLED|nr:cation transport protein-domain-containing protein [Boletus edulis BED1]